MMNDTQAKLVQLVSQLEDLKGQMKNVNLQMEEVLGQLGVDSMFQDPEGTVYKVVVPTGTFISFKKIDYARTRRGEEKTGSLSLKDARDAGYKVE